MWGNLRGWLISVGLALLMTWALLSAAIPPAPTPPTNAAVLAIAKGKIALPIPPSSIVQPGNADTDAGTFYRQAIEDYLLTPDMYAQFADRPMTVPLKKLTALEYILKARDCRTFSLFQSKPTEIVNYDNDEPALDSLLSAGTIACTVGKLYTNAKFDAHTKPDQAKKLYEAVFILGQRLFDERLTYKELAGGYSLMMQASDSLVRYYSDNKKDAAKADVITAFADATRGYMEKLNKAFTIIGGADENFFGKYAGDLFQIAASDDAENMFRVESLKHIGRYQYDSTSKGDQLATRRVLAKMADDVSLPPSVHAAAIAARDLTVEKFHTYG